MPLPPLPALSPGPGPPGPGEYPIRHKVDTDDPTMGNWPARDWPLEDLEELRQRYPEPMYANDADLKAGAGDIEGEDAIYEDSVLWSMEREERTARG